MATVQTATPEQVEVTTRVLQECIYRQMSKLGQVEAERDRLRSALRRLLDSKAIDHGSVGAKADWDFARDVLEGGGDA